MNMIIQMNIIKKYLIVNNKRMDRIITKEIKIKMNLIKQNKEKCY